MDLKVCPVENEAYVWSDMKSLEGASSEPILYFVSPLSGCSVMGRREKNCAVGLLFNCFLNLGLLALIFYFKCEPLNQSKLLLIPEANHLKGSFESKFIIKKTKE